MINFRIGFQLEEKQLQSQLSSIQGDIQRAFSVKSGLSTELTKATQQAQILEQALTRATTDKGVSYSAFTSELRKAGTTASQLAVTLASGGQAFNASLNAANTALAFSNRQVISLSKRMEEMGRVMIQSFKFTAAQTAIRAIATGVRSSVDYVKDLNKAFNDIAVVSGKSADEIDRISQRAVIAAKELRVAAKDYAEGALIFYQQGLDDAEVTRRTEITVKAAKAAGSSIDEMSSQLTAIWNTYGMVGDEQLRAASVGAQMAAQTAVDFKDIAEAMQTAAAPAAQMGVSYNSLAAIIATVGDTTQQSASIIGNAYKTIFSRMEQLKISGTDGEVTLGKISQALKDVGINIFDASGQLKDLDSVILDVGQKWESYSKAQQLAIAQNIGGTRQYGQFLALMNNFDDYLTHLNAAQGENGETLEQQYTQALDSIEERSKMAGEAWKRAFSEAIPEDTIKGIYSTLEGIGDLFGGMLKGLNGLPGLLALVGVHLSSKIIPSIITATTQVKELFLSLNPEHRAQKIAQEFEYTGAQLVKQRAKIQENAQQQKSAIAPKAPELEERRNFEDEKKQIRVDMPEEQKKRFKKQNRKTKAEIDEYNQGVDERNAQKLSDFKNSGEVKNYPTKARNIDRKAEGEIRNIQAAEAKNSFSQQSAQINDKINQKLQTATGEEKVKLEYLQQQLKVQQDIYQTSIDQGDAAAKNAQAELDKLDILEKEAQAKANSFSKDDNSKEAVQARTDVADIAQAKKIEELNVSLGNVAKTGKTSFKDIEIAAQRGVDAFGKDSAAAKEFEKVLSAMHGDKEIGKLTDAVAAAEKKLLSSKEGTKEYKQALQELNTAREQLNAKVSGFGEQLEEAAANSREVTNNFKELGPKAQEAAQHTGKIAENLRDQTRAKANQESAGGEITGKDMPNPKPSLSSVADGITQIGMAATMAIAAVSGVFKTLNDESATTGQKIAAVGTALLTLLPAIKSLTGGLNALGLQFKKAGVEGSLAGIKVQLSWWQVTLIMLAIVAVIAILVAAFNHFKSQSAAAELERATKATEELKGEAEEAANAANKLKDAFNGYESAQEKLENCKKGTQEWKDAMIEAREKMRELIASLPPENVLRNIGLQYKDIYDVQTGTINKENLGKVQDFMDKQAAFAQFTADVSEASLMTLSRNAQIEDWSKDHVEESNTNKLHKGLVSASDHGASGAARDSAASAALEEQIINGIELNYEEILAATDEQSLQDALDKAGIQIKVTAENFEQLQKDLSGFAQTTKDAHDKLNLIAQVRVNDILGDSVSAGVKAGVANAFSSQDYNEFLADAKAKLQGGKDAPEEYKMSRTKDAPAAVNAMINEIFKDQYGEGVHVADVIGNADNRTFKVVDAYGNTIAENVSYEVLATKYASMQMGTESSIKEKAQEAQQVYDKLDPSIQYLFDQLTTQKSFGLRQNPDYYANILQKDDFAVLGGKEGLRKLGYTTDQFSQIITDSIENSKKEYEKFFEGMSEDAQESFLKAIDGHEMLPPATLKRIRNKIVKEYATNGKEAGDAMAERIQEALDKGNYKINVSLDRATKEGLSTEAVMELAGVLQDTDTAITGLSDDFLVNDAAAVQLATDIKMADRAVITLSKNYKNWKTILKSDDARQYLNIRSDLIGAYGDLFGDSEFASNLSEEFLRSTENLELMGKALKKDSAAYTELVNRAKEDAFNGIMIKFGITDKGVKSKVANLVSYLQKFLNEHPGEINAILNDKNFNAALRNLMVNAGMTFTQIQALFSNFGLNIKGGPGLHISNSEYSAAWKRLKAAGVTDIEAAVKTLGSAEDPIAVQSALMAGIPNNDDITYKQKAEIATNSQTQQDLRTISAYTSAHAVVDTTSNIEDITKLDLIDTSPFDTGNTGNSNGGDKKPTKIKEQKHEKPDKPIEDRYGTIQSSVDAVERSIEKLSDAADQAWGRKKLNNLRATNDLLVKQTNNLKELKATAEEYYKTDKESLQSKLKDAKNNDLIDIEASFNDEGFIENSTELNEALQGLLKGSQDAVNAAIDEYNKFVKEHNGEIGEELKEEEETLKQNIEDAKTVVSDLKNDVVQPILDDMKAVDESAQKVIDAEKQQLEKINEWFSNRVLEVQTKLDFNIGITDRDIALMDRLINSVDQLIGVDRRGVWDKFKEQMNNNIQQVERHAGAATKAIQMMTELEASRNNPEQFKKLAEQYSTEAGEFFSEDLWNKFVESSGANRQELIDMLESQLDEAWSAIDAAKENLVSMLAEWLTMFESFMEDFDRLDVKVQKHSETIEVYTNIITALGRETSSAGAQAMLDMAKTSYSNAKTSAQIAKDKMQLANAELTSITQSLERFEGRYGDSVEEILKTGGEAAVQTWATLKEQQKTVQEACDDATSGFKSAVNEMTSKMTELLEANTNALRAAFLDNISGMFSDFSQMTEMFDKRKEFEEYYMDDLTKNYNLDKLGSSISQYLDDENIAGAALEKYNDLMDEINEKRKAGVKITEKDYEILEKQFELAKAQDAYEEAQKQKNTMRLARDASGNYNYVYSGSSSDQEQALQRIKDLQYEIEKSEQDAAAEAEQAWLNTYTNIAQLREQLADAKAKGNEEEVLRLQTLLDMEQENLQRYADEIDLRYNHIDKRFEDSTLYWLMGEQTLEDGTKIHLDNMTEMNDYFVDQMADYGKDLEETSKEVVDNFEDDVQRTTEGTEITIGDFDTLEDNIKTESEKMVTENDKVTKASLRLKMQGADTMRELTNYLNQHVPQQIQKLQEEERQVRALEEAYKALKLAQGGDVATDYGKMFAVTAMNMFGEGVTEEQIYEMLKQNQDLVDERNDIAVSHGYDALTLKELAAQVYAAIQKGWYSVDDTNWNWYGKGNENKAATIYDNKNPIEYAASGSKDVQYGIKGTPKELPEGFNIGGYTPSQLKKYNIKWDADGNVVSTSIGGEEVTDSKIQQVLFDLYNNGIWGAFKEGEQPANQGYSDIRDYFLKNHLKYGFASGGYTGEWGSDGRLAMLHEKELVLNKEDTKNILAAVQTVRDFVSTQFRAMLNHQYNNLQASTSLAKTLGVQNGQIPVQQAVQIDASFPGVTCAEEIQAALNDLINQAVQYTAENI